MSRKKVSRNIQVLLQKARTQRERTESRARSTAQHREPGDSSTSALCSALTAGNGRGDVLSGLCVSRCSTELPFPAQHSAVKPIHSLRQCSSGASPHLFTLQTKLKRNERGFWKCSAVLEVDQTQLSKGIAMRAGEEIIEPQNHSGWKGPFASSHPT